MTNLSAWDEVDVFVLMSCRTIVLSVVDDAVFSSDELGLPGVARRLLTFFASPKKVSKERRPLGRSPFGVPDVSGRKSGRENNSLRSDIFHLVIRISPADTGYSQADFETGSLRLALARSPSASWCQVPVMAQISVLSFNIVVPANAGIQ